MCPSFCCLFSLICLGHSKQILFHNYFLLLQGLCHNLKSIPIAILHILLCYYFLEFVRSEKANIWLFEFMDSIILIVLSLMNILFCLILLKEFLKDNLQIMQGYIWVSMKPVEWILFLLYQTLQCLPNLVLNN